MRLPLSRLNFQHFAENPQMQGSDKFQQNAKVVEANLEQCLKSVGVNIEESCTSQYAFFFHIRYGGTDNPLPLQVEVKFKELGITVCAPLAQDILTVSCHDRGNYGQAEFLRSFVGKCREGLRKSSPRPPQAATPPFQEARL